MMTQVVVLNFLPIGAGGGLQNSLSFVSCLSQPAQMKFVAVVRSGSLIEKECLKKGLAVLPVKRGLVRRFIFELFSFRRRLPKGALCFTFFGPPFLGGRSYFHNINGFAYSNLLYPELDFWGFEKARRKFFRGLVDLYRMWGVSRADEIIFETEVLRLKAQSHPLLAKKKLHCVRMAVSDLVRRKSSSMSLNVKDFDGLGQFKILYLAGPHPNKRIHLLLNIAQELRSLNVRNVQFVTTLPESSEYYKKIYSQVSKANLELMFYNIGPILAGDVSSVIEGVDAMINLALLESFSNNFVEAWSMGKPLIVTDADWAISCCGDAGVYVNPNDSPRAALLIKALLESRSWRSELSELGFRQLSTHPTPEEKTKQYLDILTEVED